MNTHSLVEKNYNQKKADFEEAVLKELPQIIALQEVNQTCGAEVIPKDELNDYVPCDSETIIRKDNHIYNIAKALKKKGVRYYWTWLPIKKGYDKYDEGIGIMSRSPIKDTKIITVSSMDDYSNWKTRKIIGICTEEAPEEWFYSVHFGWWEDEDDTFEDQWNKAQAQWTEENRVWIMGDFNNPAEIRGEGYDLVKKSGWADSYVCAEEKDNGFTVEEVIDGWKDKIKDTNGMRLDQIWCNKEIKVKSSKVVFNGKDYPVVSDHYGVLIDYERNIE